MSFNFTSNELPNTCNTFITNMFIVFSALRAILLLPLSVFVLYLCHQQWRQQRSFKTASHSDIFTYNMAAMELIWVLGCVCSYGGIYLMIKTVGSVATFIAYYGEVCFHVLTCVERYLAVVHPIIYLALRRARGIRIRNISIGCVWLLCSGLGAVAISNSSTIILICFVVFSTIIISFCSLSVLCVLIRPGPGEGGGQKEQVNQSKLRAFHTVTAISCSVWLWFAGLLVVNVLQQSPLLSNSVMCVVVICIIWFNLPSCLVLPLLYLHRAGKLSCYCYSKKVTVQH